MIGVLNYIQVLTPEQTGEPYTTYNVGVTTVERWEAGGGYENAHMNASNPVIATLKVFPEGSRRASVEEVNILCSPQSPERGFALGSIVPVLEALRKIEGLDHESAVDKLFGTQIEVQGSH